MMSLLERPRYRLDCRPCSGTGQLPGQNWVAQGWVRPNCFHCNGTGQIPAEPCPNCGRGFLPRWPTCRVCGGGGLVPKRSQERNNPQ